MSQKRFVDIAHHLRLLLTESGRLIDTNDDIVERALLCLSGQSLEDFSTIRIADQLSLLTPMRDRLVQYLNRLSPAELSDSGDLNRANGMIRRLEADEIHLILLEELMQIRRELNDLGPRFQAIQASDLPKLEKPQSAVWSSARAELDKLNKRLIALLRRLVVSQRSGRGLYLAREIEAARRMAQRLNRFQRELVSIDRLVRRERFFQVRNRARQVVQRGANLQTTFFDNPQEWINLNPEVTNLMIQLRRWIRDFNMHDLEPLAEDLHRLSRAISLCIEHQESGPKTGDIGDQLNRRLDRMEEMVAQLNEFLVAVVEYLQGSPYDVSALLRLPGISPPPETAQPRRRHVTMQLILGVLRSVIATIDNMVTNIFALRLEITTEPYLRIPEGALRRIRYDTHAAQTDVVNTVMGQANELIRILEERIQELKDADPNDEPPDLSGIGPG